MHWQQFIIQCIYILLSTSENEQTKNQSFQHNIVISKISKYTLIWPPDRSCSTRPRGRSCPLGTAQTSLPPVPPGAMSGTSGTSGTRGTSCRRDADTGAAPGWTSGAAAGSSSRAEGCAGPGSAGPACGRIHHEWWLIRSTSQLQFFHIN